MDSGVNSKIIFPRDEKSDLALLQQYLVFQLFLPQFQAFGIDLVITDTSKVVFDKAFLFYVLSDLSKYIKIDEKES